MDLPIQFNLIAKRILQELRTLNTVVGARLFGIQEQVRSIRDQQKTDSQQRQEQSQRPQTLNAELQIPEAIQQENRTHDNRHLTVQAVTAGATVLAFLAAAIYAGINYRMLREMRKANKAASDSFAKTLSQMQAQTAAMKELADSAWLEAKGTKAAMVSFDYRIDTGQLTFTADNSGQSIAQNVNAQIVLTRRTWPSRKLVGPTISFVVPPQPIAQPGSIPGTHIQKSFSLRDITEKDWEAILRGDQFITVEISGSYDDGFRETIYHPKICESLIWLSKIKWEHNESGGSPDHRDCGLSFDTAMTDVMRERREMEEQILKEGKK